MSRDGPVKVVFTMTFAERLGGCEEFLWTFLRHLDRQRVEPLVIFNMSGPFPDELAALGIRTQTIEHGRLRQVHRGAAAVWAMRRAFLAERPDLIVNWFTKAHFYAGPAAVLARMRDRVVWFQHTLPGGTDMDRVVTALPAQAILTSSRAGAEQQQLIWPSRSTRVVHPGIEEPAAMDQRERYELRRALGIPAGREVIGVVGRLQPWKQQHLVVEAVQRLREGGRDVHGLIVGGNAHDAAPEYEPYLRRMVQERGLTGFVTFTGQVPEARRHIQVMDVFVNSSDHEPFGIVLVEAMALRVPAVAFDSAGGPPEILEHGEAGLLVRPGDVAHLAAQIERLLSDRPLRLRVVERGRRRFEESYTASRMADELTGVLTGLAVRSG